MEKNTLTITRLEAAGFRPAGAWVASDDGIRRQGIVPGCAGVYAFAVDDRVMYVGLASTNLTKRLYFYQNPAATQRTNLRLNALIAKELLERSVTVYFACPPDFEWNGIQVKGAEGLEAGMIASFDLPWNMRGNVRQPVAAIGAPTETRKAMQRVGGFNTGGTAIQRVLSFIAAFPSRTEAEIAKEVFGRGTPQQRVNPICRELVKLGRITRHGVGGVTDPYTYTARR